MTALMISAPPIHVIVQGGDSAAWAAAIGAVLGALVGGLLAFWATRRQVTAEDRRVREQRLADTYVDVVRLVHTTMAQVEQTRPAFRFAGLDEVPPLSFDEEATIKARLEVFGSHPVRELFIEWRGNLHMFLLGVGELNTLAGGPDEGRPDDVPVAQWTGLSQEMNQSRDALRTATRSIESAVRAELGVAPPDLAPTTPEQ